jgi:hypothetical protein
MVLFEPTLFASFDIIVAKRTRLFPITEAARAILAPIEVVPSILALEMHMSVIKVAILKPGRRNVAPAFLDGSPAVETVMSLARSRGSVRAEAAHHHLG